MLNDDVVTDAKGGKWACGAVVMEYTKFFGAECAFFEQTNDDEQGLSHEWAG